jgi:hypothetical protein
VGADADVGESAVESAAASGGGSGPREAPGSLDRRDACWLDD